MLSKVVAANFPDRFPGSLQEEVDFLRRGYAELKVSQHELIDRLMEVEVLCDHCEYARTPLSIAAVRTALRGKNVRPSRTHR